MDGVSVFQGDPGGNVKMTEGETIRDAWGNGQTILRSVLQFQGFFSVLDAVYGTRHNRLVFATSPRALRHHFSLKHWSSYARAKHQLEEKAMASIKKYTETFGFK